MKPSGSIPRVVGRSQAPQMPSSRSEYAIAVRSNGSVLMAGDGDAGGYG